MIVPVILSGGAGTRLWPLSRELYPKQLLPLLGQRTLIQQTVLRASQIQDAAAPIVVCNEEHRFLVAEQLRAIDVEPQAILLEPSGRNTAPAVALAAIYAIDQSGRTATSRDAGDDDPVLVVLPADHVVSDPDVFVHAAAQAIGAARDGSLVTFGIVPTAPETGYGYIRAGDPEDGVRQVAEFVEKPDLTTAENYVASGEYLWNSGMFVFRASRYVKELRTHAPKMVEACTAAISAAREDLDFIRVDKDAWAACPADSIDYAVMEKTRDAKVVPLDAGWSDIGSWSALHDASEKDEDHNVAHGDVLLEDCTNSYVHSDHRLVCAVGLEGHIVVETKDAVLVAPRDRVQDVKKLVARLKQANRYEAGLHRQVYRPWGSYDGVDSGDRFQVKRLIVNPGAVLSLQMHHHRAEHWVVVQGTARVTRNDEVFLVRENESTFIPQGAVHRIENPGKVPLHIIEVQSGSYLGEDDIVRFEDNYGREGETPKG
jgi:mannose-1-phosphate guanylyltransferase/mannose-6-phosphate isomerase